MITYYKTDSNGIFNGAVELNPFSALPAGSSVEPPEITGTEVAQLQGAEWVVLPRYPEPTPEQISQQQEAQAAAVKKAMTDAIQARLDEFAQSRGYDGILSACTYATSAVPRFASEGQACVNLRDATWLSSYAIMAAVEAGERPIPSLADVLAELPELVWPVTST